MRIFLNKLINIIFFSFRERDQLLKKYSHKDESHPQEVKNL